jgi:hypothetical protein
MRQGYYYHRRIDSLCAGDSDASYKQISTSIGRPIKSASTVDSSLLPLAIEKLCRNPSVGRQGWRPTWGPSPAMGRRRGDTVRQGDLGEGRQRRILLWDEDLHAGDEFDHFGARWNRGSGFPGSKKGWVADGAVMNSARELVGV